LVRRKYRLLFSAKRRPKKPGPKRPDEALIRASVELKSRNPRFGCPRIARIIAQTFGIDIDPPSVARWIHARGRRCGFGFLVQQLHDGHLVGEPLTAFASYLDAARADAAGTGW